MIKTPIQELGELYNNQIFVKREDLIPFSFGGNKARKAILFFEEIDAGDYDYVVTYGGSHSNHCRVVANMAASRGLKCVIIGPEEVSDPTFNSRMMQIFGAEIITVPVEKVHKTIENILATLKTSGHKPYFIEGGGHGNIGTEAYVQCYDDITEFEKSNNLKFDYIFFASGTGTTQAGLVCGQIIHGDDRQIIGISIARKNPRGRDIILQSECTFLNDRNVPYTIGALENATTFIDDYTGDGYGKNSEEIINLISNIMLCYGLPLDSTYTGKAFLGMKKYLQKKTVNGNTILFIHTGGTPLFFDDLNSISHIMKGNAKCLL
jgi:D-cysteine desulfhydrase